MAKQVGPIYYEGTIGDIVFYQMNGQYYARFKGNYKNKKQMQRIPKYKRTLQLSSQFGQASKAASWVYQRYLSKELKSRSAWGQFSGKATRLRNSGKSDKEIKAALIHYCEQLTLEAAAVKQATLTQAKATTNKGKHTPTQSRYLPLSAPKQLKVKHSLFAIPPIPDPQIPIPLSSINQ